VCNTFSILGPIPSIFLKLSVSSDGSEGLEVKIGSEIEFSGGFEVVFVSAISFFLLFFTLAILSFSNLSFFKMTVVAGSKILDILSVIFEFVFVIDGLSIIPAAPPALPLRVLVSSLSR